MEPGRVSVPLKGAFFFNSKKPPRLARSRIVSVPLKGAFFFNETSWNGSLGKVSRFRPLKGGLLF